MNIFQTLGDVPDSFKGGVIAIGNFDGVHGGHRALLREAKNMAEAKNIPLGVLTFEPHPRKLFRPDDPPFRITPPTIKHRLLFGAGVTFIVSLPFDWDFASQSAETFVRSVLTDGLAPAHVLIGFDFRFGQLRQGNAATIQNAGIPVTEFPSAQDEHGQKISSTAIRNALRAGDTATANRLLGWEWEIEGAVFRGDRRGHELGFPTANVLLGDILHPAYGIYAAMVQIEGEDLWRPAATNIGIRPMFELKQGQVEAHILDFEDRDIYGRLLRVRPVSRLRGEAKFPSLDALIAQIRRDCEQTRTLLNAA